VTAAIHFGQIDVVAGNDPQMIAGPKIDVGEQHDAGAQTRILPSFAAIRSAGSPTRSKATVSEASGTGHRLRSSV
jgi:hypothetical protein